MKVRRKKIQEINKKISQQKAIVLTADGMTQLVREIGPEKAFSEVDVVTTGTFGAMCSSGAFLNFGHSEPPIKMQRVWLNEVEAYTGIAAVDAYLGVAQLSETKGMAYGGGHVLEDLVRRKPVILKAIAYGTNCYPRKALETQLTLDDLNQAILLNPRNAYERYNAATNSSSKTLHTYMGTLLPNFGNVTFAGCGELSPLINDPEFRTIGLGTKIFLGRTIGYVIGPGTQHNPESGFATLMVSGNLKEMSSEFLRAATFPGYGCTMFIGIGIAIPILDSDLARTTGISDEEIFVNILDYGIPSRNRPIVKKVTYAELKSGEIKINGQRVKTSSLSSYARAQKIAQLLKSWIKEGRFLLNEPVERLPQVGSFKPLVERMPVVQPVLISNIPSSPAKSGSSIFKDDSLCVDCGLCLSLCSSGVFSRGADSKIVAKLENCTNCGRCRNSCPVGAIF